MHVQTPITLGRTTVFVHVKEASSSSGLGIVQTATTKKDLTDPKVGVVKI
jgi:hypothetical protein